MSPLLKKIIRLAAGVAIIVVGFTFMQVLIGMKTVPSVVIQVTHSRPVKTTIVENSTHTPEIQIEGRVEAWNRIDLFAEVNGVLNLGGKEFREGVTYSKGEIIIKLDDSEARATLRSARAQFLQLTTSILANIKVDFPNRIVEWESFVKSIDVKETLPDLPVSRSDRENYYVVNRGVNANYHAIKASEERLSKYEIIAPFDGFVSTTTVTPGALVRGGQPLGVFVGSSVHEVKTSISSDLLSYLSVGDLVEFVIDSEKVSSGQLDRISSNVNPKTQSATAYFKINNFSTDLQVRDGMYLAGTVFVDEITSCIEIPTNIIDNGMIYSVVDGELQHIKVNVVFESFGTVLVKGVPDGTAILIEQISDAYPGMKVNPSSL
jgi:multidrug efflux pump subunit AcrA (membrane-fusion protein)